MPFPISSINISRIDADGLSTIAREKQQDWHPIAEDASPDQQTINSSPVTTEPEHAVVAVERQRCRCRGADVRDREQSRVQSSVVPDSQSL